MAARVTVSEVREIIDTALGDAGVAACISAANALIDSKTEMVSLLLEDTLTQIELWVAAHNVSVADPRVTEERTRETSVKYAQPKVGTGLTGSPYGQVAISLDTTLTLADAPATRRASFRVL
jgi:hypothetical protein